MKIYTKTGDKGETGIIGKRLSKASSLIESLGTLDEANASIGIVLNRLNASDLNSNEKDSIKADLINTQNIIFSIGGILANGNVKVDLVQATKDLENKIDSMSKEIEPLQNFILPGGSDVGSFIHLSRAICRKAERRLVELFIDTINGEPTDVNPNLRGDEILPYINRLSDYFFTLARYVNKLEGESEVIWESR
jgi:cob(I)alamin adenosyltransferase